MEGSGAPHRTNPSSDDGFSFLSRNENFDPNQGNFLGIVATFSSFLPISKTGLGK